MQRAWIAPSALLALALVAAPASAQLSTAQNGIENIALAPVDFAVAPVVAAQTMGSNMTQAQMTGGRRVVTMTIGLPWIWTLQGVLSGARIVAGVSEVLLGLALAPVDLFHDVPERQLFDATTYSPMVNRQGSFDVVFGAHYFSTQ